MICKNSKPSFPGILLSILIVAFSLVGNQLCQAEELDTVTIQLRWKHQFQFAGYYAAIEKGYYAEEGIEVSLLERHPGTTPYSEVLEGRADYGVADAGLLLHRIQGKPVVLLTQIFQHSPLIFISRQDSGIISPFEMAGKTVMYEPDSDSAPLNAMLVESPGIIKKIKQVPHSMNYDDLVSGKVDVISAYLTDQPFSLKRQGVAINIINPQNYGIDFYGDNLFTSDQELKKHPGRAEKVTRATLKGWQYALDHSDEIIDLILTRYNSQSLDRDFLEYEARMTGMMILADLIPLGQINTGRYQRVAKVYRQLGLIKEALVPEGFVYQKPMVKLSEAEQSWISDHPRIVLGSNQDNKPYIQVDKNGVVHGFAADYIELIREKTGLNISLKAGSWPKQMALIARGELDGLSLVTQWETAENNLLLSEPIHKTYKIVFALNSRNLKINSLKDLKGMRVGIRKGLAFERALFRNIPDVNLIEAETIQEQIECLAADKVDVILGGIITQNFLEKHTIVNVNAAYIVTGEEPAYGFAVRSDWPELHSIINKGLAAITEDERAAIVKKWTQYALADSDKKKLSLNKEESQWLQAHPDIRIGIDPGWPPIEFVNAGGEYQGITSDIIALAEKELGFATRLALTRSWAETMAAARAGTIDMVPAMVNTRKRQDIFNFTIPYLEFPVVIMTHEDLPYISGMDDLGDKKLAVIDQFSLSNQLRQEFPDYTFISYPDAIRALTGLAEKEVDAFVVNTASVNYALKRKEFSRLKVAAPTTYTYQLSFGVRKDWPELIPILDKFIASIPSEEKQAIEKSWLNLQVEREVDWQTVIRFGSILVVMGGMIILVFVFWNRSLSCQIKRRKEAEDTLQQYQHQLETQVEERTAELAATNVHLLASERKFRGIFHNTYQFIGLLNVEGTLLECNDTSLAFIGKTAEEVVGQDFWDTPWWNYSEDVQQDLKSYIKRAAAGEIVNVDVVHHDLQGKVHYVIFSLKPIFDEEGEVSLIVTEGRDISHQKINELRFRTLFDTANDAILIMHEQRVVQCNPKALKIFGCDSSQLLGVSPDKFSPPFQPDGRDSRESAGEKVNAAYKGELLTFEWQHCRLDGTPFDAEVSLNATELEGEKFLQAIVRDVTARKDAEKQLRRLASAIEQAAESIAITDLEGIIEYVNPAFEKITGYTASEAIGQTPALLKSGVHGCAFYGDLWNTITAGRIWKGCFTNKTKDGVQFIEDATISPILDSSGECMGYVAVKRDLTKQIKLETDLRQAQKMEAIGTLAGGIAHDFNNILSAIFGYSELGLMHLENTDKLRHDLNQVHQAAERARDLVKQILTFSRKSDQIKQPLQIALIVREVVKLIRSSIPSTIEIKQQINAADKMVLADPTQIHQILMNLCTNGYHAMRETGGVLGVSLQEKNIGSDDQVLGGNLKPGNYLELEISDTGSGMDATIREKIFEPYFTTREAEEGTGLGLAVVHGIVQDHHGMIHVYSEPGYGSVFRVYLPTIEGSSNDRNLPKENIDHDGGNQHIMFVDDEEDILGVVEEVFKVYGYRVSVFSNPAEGLDAFARDPSAYDLMITDMTMPGMTGAELAEKVLALRPGFPIILATGYSELINKDKAMALGFCEYISKPMVMSKLIAVVKRVLSAGERV